MAELELGLHPKCVSLALFGVPTFNTQSMVHVGVCSRLRKHIKTESRDHLGKNGYFTLTRVQIGMRIIFRVISGSTPPGGSPNSPWGESNPELIALQQPPTTGFSQHPFQFTLYRFFFASTTQVPFKTIVQHMRDYFQT